MLVQQALLHWGCEEHDRNFLPRAGADGISEAKPTLQSGSFRESVEQKVDGIVGPEHLGRTRCHGRSVRHGAQRSPDARPAGNQVGAAEPISNVPDMDALVKSTTFTLPHPKMVRSPLQDRAA